MIRILTITTAALAIPLSCYISLFASQHSAAPEGVAIVSDSEAADVEGGFCLRLIYGTPTAILYNCGGVSKDGAVCNRVGQVMWVPFLGTLGYNEQRECTECGNECGWYDRIIAHSCE
jgi:hypothetical protein